MVVSRWVIVGKVVVWVQSGGNMRKGRVSGVSTF